MPIRQVESQIRARRMEKPGRMDKKDRAVILDTDPKCKCLYKACYYGRNQSDGV